MATAKRPKLTNQLITDAFKSAKSRSIDKKLSEKHDLAVSEEEINKANDALCTPCEKTEERKEEARKADFDILREFDLNQEYGPCIGLSRLERWNRAQKLGLNPPLNVRRLIEFHALEKDFSACVWTAYNI